MIKEEIKFENSTVFEGMTSIRAIIKSIDSKIGNRQILKILYSEQKYKKIAKEVGYLKAVSNIYGYEISACSDEEIEKYTVGNSHGGIIAFATDRTIPYLSIDDIKDGGFYVLIEGIEDPYNFGYALRSLYPAGCDGIILSERNWFSAAGVVARSSAGASELFSSYKLRTENDIELFKKCGYKIVCADENTENTLGKVEIKRPVLLIVGGEKRGISKSILDKADMRVKIDYEREFSASLSAASATTMFAYEIMRQNQK
jgi:23S rRNA (guanosine2251-2'-O)-methyltransferase